VRPVGTLISLVYSPLNNRISTRLGTRVVAETHGAEVTFPWTVDLIGAISVTAPIFYGGAIAGMGFLTIYYRDFPLYTIAPSHSEIPGQ